VLAPRLGGEPPQNKSLFASFSSEKEDSSLVWSKADADAV
jgi:hypothetical protein